MGNMMMMMTSHGLGNESSLVVRFVGADLVMGSLIKKAGGTLAPCGGYGIATLFNPLPPAYLLLFYCR
jgi:hypothetical protein